MFITATRGRYKILQPTDTRLSNHKVVVADLPYLYDANEPEERDVLPVLVRAEPEQTEGLQWQRGDEVQEEPGGEEVMAEDGARICHHLCRRGRRGEEKKVRRRELKHSDKKDERARDASYH